jgi:hypothetical protein
MEEQLLGRERAINARESTLQLQRRQNHQGSMLRANSLPLSMLEESEPSADSEMDDRRMSLQNDDHLLERHNFRPAVEAPFKIFSEERECSEKNGDEFTSGIARARELLGRPRIQHGNDGAEIYPPGATGSTFYKNYLANKRLNEGTENINPFVHVRPDGMRKAPKIPSQQNQNEIVSCGSASKRKRTENENIRDAPSVQVDLQSLIVAGRGKFDSL